MNIIRWVGVTEEGVGLGVVRARQCGREWGRRYRRQVAGSSTCGAGDVRMLLHGAAARLLIMNHR